MQKALLLLAVTVFTRSGALSASDSEPKSVSKAMTLSAILPGAGEFYIGNIWKGLLDVGIEAGLVGTTILLIKIRKNFPPNSETKKEELSREDCIAFAAITAIFSLAYHGFQIWRVHDDAIAYNYKKKFLSYQCSVGLKDKALCLKISRRF